MARASSTQVGSTATNRAAAAFTLVELLVAIGIVALLAATAWGGLHAVRQRAAETQAKAELALLAQLIEEYRWAFGELPQVDDTPERLYQALLGRLGPTGDAMQARSLIGTTRLALRDPEHPEAADNCFVDPWGRPYLYIFWTRDVAGVEAVRHYTLYSFGAREKSAAGSLLQASEVVPATHGDHGGEVAEAALQSGIIFAGD